MKPLDPIGKLKHLAGISWVCVCFHVCVCCNTQLSLHNHGFLRRDPLLQCWSNDTIDGRDFPLDLMVITELPGFVGQIPYTAAIVVYFRLLQGMSYIVVNIACCLLRAV